MCGSHSLSWLNILMPNPSLPPDVFEGSSAKGIRDRPARFITITELDSQSGGCRPTSPLSKREAFSAPLLAMKAPALLSPLSPHRCLCPLNADGTCRRRASYLLLSKGKEGIRYAASNICLLLRAPRMSTTMLSALAAPFSHHPRPPTISPPTPPPPLRPPSQRISHHLAKGLRLTLADLAACAARNLAKASWLMSGRLSSSSSTLPPAGGGLATCPRTPNAST